MAACLLGLALLAPVAGAAPGALFAEGASAFKRGDFAGAVDYFRQARAAGLDTPALHYNLGASFYKLGRYAEAEAAFRACARDPAWTALAYYNMGLSAYARGERELARAYVEDAWRNAEADNVRALAAALLERLGVPRRRTPAVLQANLGYNDNVTLRADDQTLQTRRASDAFAEFLASANGRVGARAQAPRWEASFYSVNYRTLSDNDITELLLGASQPEAFAGWRWEAGAQWQYVWLDGRAFQDIASLQLAGTRELANQRDLRVSARASAIDARDGHFEFLAGSRQQLELSLGQPARGGQIRTGLVWERNNRHDLATADEFFSYSPTRYGLWAAGSWPLGAQWRLEPTAFYYQGRYADPDIRASGLIRTRVDRRTELGLRLKRRLSATWQLIAEYNSIDNNSNLPEFSYSQRLILLGLTRPL